MLSRAGFACETAHNGSEAVDKVRGRHANRAVYDVILMDFFMPEMNGPDAVKEIRALGYQGIVLGTSTAFPARLCVTCRLTRRRLPFSAPYLPPFAGTRRADGQRFAGGQRHFHARRSERSAHQADRAAGHPRCNERDSGIGNELECCGCISLVLV